MDQDETPKTPNGDGREEAEAREETEEAEAAEPESTPEPDAEGNETTEDLESSTDGADFAARYHSLKEKEMKRLAKEMEERASAPAKSKKNRIMSIVKTVLLIALIALSIGIMFGLGKYISGENAKSFVSMVKGANPYYFVAFLAVFLFFLLNESLKYSYLLKISTGKFRIKNSIKTMFLGKYYDGITPMSTGGQPFQIYYLHKKQDLPKGAATAIPLIRYLVSALVVTLISIALLIITPYHLENSIVKTTTVIMSWISIALNCLFPIVIIVFSFIPKRTERLIAAIIKLLAKMHIVKHQYAVTKKWVFELREYSKAIKSFGKKFWQLIPVVILSGMETMLSYSIPFFTVIAIAGVAPTAELYVQIICFAMITRYTALLIPTPGNTGAVETTGSLLLITMTASVKPLIGWVVLVWRFFTYYIYILTGIGINIFEIIRGAVRNKRAKNKKE